MISSLPAPCIILPPGTNLKFDGPYKFEVFGTLEAIGTENDSIILHENIATAMGNYYFKDKSGEKIKVEYTLVYIKRTRGEIKIILHHSSLPYNLNQ